jgi:predicted DNA-binding protein
MTVFSSLAESLSMPESSPTISLRLPHKARERLDRATVTTRRSRSFLMQRALEMHLDEIEREEAVEPVRRLTTVLALGGAGATVTARRGAAEIDEHVRWLRDSD